MRRLAAAVLLLAAVAADARAGPPASEPDRDATSELTPAQRQTAALLALLLSPAAQPATGPPGEDCALSPGAVTLAQDLLQTLAALDAHGRIASRCEPAGAVTRCDLQVGQTPASDALWARTWRIPTNAAHTALAGPVACFTIP